MTKVHNIEKGEVLSLVVVNERLGASLPRISNIVMEKNVEDVDRPRLCVKAASCRRLGGEGYSSVVAHARSGSGIRARARRHPSSCGRRLCKWCCRTWRMALGLVPSNFLCYGLPSSMRSGACACCDRRSARATVRPSALPRSRTLGSGKTRRRR